MLLSHSETTRPSRRNFLKHGSLLVPALAAGGGLLTVPKMGFLSEKCS
jgi:hypothetical protein